MRNRERRKSNSMVMQLALLLTLLANSGIVSVPAVNWTSSDLNPISLLGDNDVTLPAASEPSHSTGRGAKAEIPFLIWLREELLARLESILLIALYQFFRRLAGHRQVWSRRQSTSRCLRCLNLAAVLYVDRIVALAASPGVSAAAALLQLVEPCLEVQSLEAGIHGIAWTALTALYSISLVELFCRVAAAGLHPQLVLPAYNPTAKCSTIKSGGKHLVHFHVKLALKAKWYWIARYRRHRRGSRWGKVAAALGA